MAVLSGLSNAHAILLATHLCASGNVTALPLLHARFPTALRLERLLRIILTFLPESTEPQSYTSVLQSLVDGSPVEVKEDDIDVSSVKDIEVTVAQKRVRKLHLLPLRYPADDEDEDTTDPLTQFLIHRAHRIDTETGLQSLILDLLLPFYQRSETIRTWLISVILPLLRLNYEYYPDKEDTVAIETIESMDDQTAINVLLSISGSDEDNMDLARNLRGLIGAWMYGAGRSKRRKLNQPAQDASVPASQSSTTKREITIARWQDVNEWLLSRSLVDYERVVGAFTNWNGPDDVDLGGYEESATLQADEAAELKKRYGQTGLAAVYANPDTSRKALEGSFQITKRVAQVLGLEQYFSADMDDAALPTLEFAMDSVSSTTRASLLQNNLLARSNPLTVPPPESAAFMNALLMSLRTLDDLGRQIPCRSAANICLHSNDDGQLLELRGLVETVAKHARPGRNWVNVRQQVLWLRDWRAPEEAAVDDPGRAHRGLFWRVSRTTAETEILKAMLATKGPTDIQVAVDIYTQPGSSALSSQQVESAVKEAIFTAYDNASNGNKTRGGIKRATEILQAFRPHFPSSTSFRQIDALIAATHALSFYSLKLQHGVPFQPVSIRVHPDPIYLIEKVLEQNPKSYTKLDDLLSIGRNLVAAGLVPSSNNESHPEDHLPAESPEKVTVTTERRIISLAVSSALSSNDFGTAYSYILTRLTPPSLLPNSSTPSTTVEDDISWRAAYNAGRHRSATQESPSPNLQSQIAHLSQRMELLSLALVLAPPEPLPEILGAWRRCDEEISVLHTRENDEAELWDLKGDKASLTAVPGGFGPTDTELDAFENEQQRARRAHARRDRSNRSMYEEAPMGLFDVARGAARAISKNAFPLHSSLSASAEGSSMHGRASEDSSLGSSTGEHDESRVRKRDMVSNMVTGGLATGIGWVLGAQPVNR
ncbi:protein transport protein Sec39 [Paecilomyces variotii No. 5]|uniref:Protein transport protein Sec39 n=1 Tax=Byssochlamys spectabilis (strain No. 5 / NBRC 109023) TaxID=1356009 RepID=V5GEA4_BYSSN|nr:protein transport protein Sec39 [Paecilomyces variotii No. 5]